MHIYQGRLDHRRRTVQVQDDVDRAVGRRLEAIRDEQRCALDSQRGATASAGSVAEAEPARISIIARVKQAAFIETPERSGDSSQDIGEDPHPRRR